MKELQNQVVQFLKEIQYRCCTHINKNRSEHAGRFESISNFQKKNRNPTSTLWFCKFKRKGSKEKKEKVRASLPPSRSI